MSDAEQQQQTPTKRKPRPRKASGTVSSINKNAASRVVVEEATDGQVDGQKVDGQVDGQKDGQVDGQKDGQKAPDKEPAAKAEPKQRGPENPYYTRKGFAPAAGCKLYEATGASGQIAVRSYSTPPVVAIDKADPQHPRLVDRLGCIFHMYPTNEAAEKVAAKLRDQGLVATIVPVRPYAGQPGDPK